MKPIDGLKIPTSVLDHLMVKDVLLCLDNHILTAIMVDLKTGQLWIRHWADTDGKVDRVIFVPTTLEDELEYFARLKSLRRLIVPARPNRVYIVATTKSTDSGHIVSAVVLRDIVEIEEYLPTKQSMYSQSLANVD